MANTTTKLDSARWEVWYWFLRQGLKAGLPFDEKVYGSWGTKAEIETWGFKKWWETRGKEIARRAQSTDPEVVEKTESTITIRFPLSMPSQQVKAKASALVARARGTKRINKGKAPTSFHYTKIKQLQRFLKIDLDKRYSGYALERKGQLLKDRYVRIGEGHAKAVRRYRERADELQKAGASDAGRRYRRRAIRLEEYKSAITDSWNPTAAKEILDLSADKLGRWAVQARLILLNVAKGEFPGADWYGNRRFAAYKQRLKEFGIDEIGASRHKGGAKDQGRKELKRRAEERLAKGLKTGNWSGGRAMGAITGDHRDLMQSLGKHDRALDAMSTSTAQTMKNRISVEVAEARRRKEKKAKQDAQSRATKTGAVPANRNP